MQILCEWLSMSDFSLYILHSYSNLKSVLSGILDLISHMYYNIQYMYSNCTINVHCTLYSLHYASSLQASISLKSLQIFSTFQLCNRMKRNFSSPYSNALNVWLVLFYSQFGSIAKHAFSQFG